MKALIIQIGVIVFTALYVALPDLVLGPIDDIIVSIFGIVTAVILQRKRKGK